MLRMLIVRHASKIVNGNRAHYGTWVWANDTSDLEVQHSGTTVNYYSMAY